MHRCAWLVPLVLAAGCNQVLGLDPVTGSDGGALDAAAIDADDVMIDGAPIDGGPAVVWGLPTLVFASGMPTTDEQDPTISPDGTELYLSFAASASGQRDIHRSLRIGAAWGPHQIVTQVSSAQNDGSPRLDRLGTTLYLSSDRVIGGQGAVDLWGSTRLAAGLPWSQPTQQPNINTAFNERSAATCDVTGRFVFSSDRDGDGDHDLFEVVGSVITPIDVAATAVPETSPFLTADCLTLYFSADVGGSYDLFTTSRLGLGEPFTNVTRIAELSNSEDNETDPWLSRDGRLMLFASGDGGLHELYQARR